MSQFNERSMHSSNRFEYTSRHRKNLIILGIAGVVLILIGIFTGTSADRIWSNFLLDTIFFLGISVLALFFIASHQIALSGWHILIKRVMEAVNEFAKVGAICMLIIIGGVWFGYHHLYHHWTNDFVKQERISAAELQVYEHELAEEGGHEEQRDYSRQWQDFQYHTIGQHGISPGEISHQEHAEEDNIYEGNPNSEGAFHGSETPSALEEDATTSKFKDEVDDGKIENPYYDKLIAGKSSYLNKPFWTLRALIYIGLWLWIGYKLRKYSLAEDTHGTTAWYMKSKFWSALFLVVWAVSSSMMAWDWVMSLDPHWYSTLFGWYNFISLWVSCICTIILLVIFLKRRGYMVEVNENHLHDLGKYAFGFSIFWTYLWFSQFMLYWYANIPEETRWFLDRARTDYKFLFYTNLIVNFLVPFLVLMRRDAKRDMRVLVIMAAVLLAGHWLDFFVMIMPATIGNFEGIGLVEVGMIFIFSATFLIVVFKELTKASLIPINHPLVQESLHHHQ